MQSIETVPKVVSLDVWTRDPQSVKDFVALAIADGLRPSSLDQGRGVLIRYDQFLRERFALD